MRTIAWQMYGGLVATFAIFGALGEAGWWIFYLYDRSTVDRVWTIAIHSIATTAALMLWHYHRSRAARDRALALAGTGADLESRVLSFRIGPFAVSMEIGFFVAIVTFGFLLGDLVRAAAFVVSATIAVLLHELGHAYAAHRCGHVASIRLHVAGGTTWHMGRLLTKGAHVAITLAGPAAGLIAGGAVYAIQSFAPPANPHAAAIVRDIVMVNAGWALVNLLPILPLDGGEIVYGIRPLARFGHGASLALAIAAGAFVFLRAAEAGAFTFLLLAAYNFGETRLGQRVCARLPYAPR